MSRTISTVYKSLVRAVNDAVADVADLLGEEVRYWSFESRLDEDKMPTCTLLGLDGYAFDENKGLWEIRAGISLSTYEDRNNHREAEILDLLHQRFGYENKVDVLNPDTGEVVTQLHITAFQIMPMGQSEMRNYRTIGLELLRTDTTEL